MTASRTLLIVSSLLLLPLGACDSESGGGGEPVAGDTSGGALDATAAEESGLGTLVPLPDVSEPGPDETDATEPDPPVCDCASGFTCVDGACVEDTEPVEPLVCDTQGFTMAHTAFETETNGDWVYGGLDGTAPGFNNLKIRFKPSAVSKAGAIDLTGKTASTCDVCVSIDGDCTAGGGKVTCSESYFATAGRVVIDAVPSGPAPQALPPTPPGQLPVSPGLAQPTCVEDGTGNLVGANIANFELRNCYGDLVGLHDSCGETEATWLIAVAQWCTACTSLLNAISGEVGGDINNTSIGATWPGVEMKVLYFEDLYRNAPTQANCMAYANSHKLDPAMVVMDNGVSLRGSLEGVGLEDPATGASWCVDGLDFEVHTPATVGLVDPAGYGIEVTGLATTYQYLNPYLAATAQGFVNTYTPWHAVLRTSNMEYVWSSYYQNLDVFEVLNSVVLGLK